ncbi:hypothetical protein CH370_11260 [Leptospira kmetyi]|uniref:hypothetical protein n=1 Tax=Leptospira kmetyi TaxID=408139 RepID=UPI000C2B3053|nr:hypothetical protein [Leptospira kmetyi]PJZ41368.1 hypothetical protein CH370_11260 [Leptospira kmetyi]
MKNLTILFLSFFILYFPLFAENLDPQKLSEIRKTLSVTRHMEDPNELKADLEVIAADPSPYLIAVIQEPGIRVYVRTRALNLLQFYSSDKTAQFLESKISANNEHDSVRKFAIRSYAISQKDKSSKVESFLGKYKSDSNLGGFVQRTLKEHTLNRPLDSKNSPNRELDRSQLKK